MATVPTCECGGELHVLQHVTESYPLRRYTVHGQPVTRGKPNDADVEYQEVVCADCGKATPVQDVQVDEDWVAKSGLYPLAAYASRAT